VVVTPPFVTYTDSLSLHLGEHTVDLRHYGHGHTEDDTVIFAQNGAIVFLGDLLSNGHAPVLGDGNSHGWEQALEAVEARTEIESLAGGHGPAGDRRALAEQRACIQAYRQAVRKLYDDGVPEDQAVAEFRSVPGFEAYLYPNRLATGVRTFYAEFGAG